jgi:hypothetical protein
MAEDTTVQPDEQESPAETPDIPDSEAIRKMVEAEAQRIVDQRIPGLQSAYEKQLAKLRKDLKTAQSGEAYDYSSQEATDYQRQLEQAQREAAMLRAGRQYPNAFPAYEAIMAAESAEEQLELLDQFLSPRQEQEQKAPPQAPTAPPTPPIDQNNPPSTPPPAVDGPSDMDAAMRIIDAVGPVWPSELR